MRTLKIAVGCGFLLLLLSAYFSSLNAEMALPAGYQLLLLKAVGSHYPPENSVHVSSVGVDTDECGEHSTPCLTIQKALARASAYMPVRPIALAVGSYRETVVLSDGVSLFGGYNNEFVKDGSGNSRTTIEGVIENGEAVGMVVENFSQPTLVDSVDITSPAATESGKSSYGILISNSPNLTLRNCTIRANVGGNGTDGTGNATAAPSGQQGHNGSPGDNWHAYQPVPEMSCGIAEVLNGFGGGGGMASKQGSVNCGTMGGRGGTGGVDICDGFDGGSGGVAGTAVTSCSDATQGQGGTGGLRSLLNTSTCVATRKGAPGNPGCDGRNGDDGVHGEGGHGEVVGNYWAPTDGKTGDNAPNTATAGGGGGGGGGGECSIQHCYGECISDRGGGGGGGGSAGCFGSGGTGGTSSGGSFGIFISQSSSTIILEDCQVFTADGGRGGRGGVGQPGGTGALGGEGGDGFEDSGSGINGGKGGDGGRGGHGGGGAGGPSVGIYVVSGVSPTIKGVTYTIGSAGQGGKAGGIRGNKGEDGIRQEVVTQ